MPNHGHTVILVDEPDAGDFWERDLKSAGLTFVRASMRAVLDGSAAAPQPVLLIVCPAVVERLFNPMESLRQLSLHGQLVVIVPPQRLFLAAYLLSAGICVARSGQDPLASIARGILERPT